MVQQYDGFYAKFEAFSKKDAGILAGADTIVGDEFHFEVSENDDGRIAVIVNRFGARIGFFDDATLHKLQLATAREWEIHILLSFVAYTSEPEPGHYWGEMCILTYDKSVAAEFDVFKSRIAETLAQGIRPAVDLSLQGYDAVISNKGDWVSNERVPMPKPQNGMAIIKSKRKGSEELIEKGRQGNIGCYIVSILFIVVVVAAIAAVVLLLMGILAF